MLKMIDIAAHPAAKRVLLCALLAGVLWLFRRLLVATQTPARRLPPGPRPWPLIGNLLDLPPPDVKGEIYWTQNREKYGPITSLSVFGTTIIAVNDADVAIELLEKRASKYSNRPRMPFLNELMQSGLWGTLSHGDRHRSFRKMTHSSLGSATAVEKWYPCLDTGTRRYLLKLLQHPEKFCDHIESTNGDIGLQMLYGYTAIPDESGHEPMLKIITACAHQFNEAAVPGKWLVDTLPALRHVPDWMPGAGFKRIARSWKADYDIAVEKPYAFAKRQIQQKTAKPSLISTVFEKQGSRLTGDEESNLQWAALSLVVGAADTSIVQMQIFFLDMALFPEVQKKAQAEIDAIVGTDRLPDSSDRPKLPYFEALLKEVVRWEPIGPSGIPHTTTEDDSYNGYHIPKGAVVLPNTAAMFHDPAVYKDPTVFNVERFLGNEPERDPSEVVWGFGRRVCPGRYLAHATLWLQMVRTVAVFDITAIKGQEPKAEFIPALLNPPKPFKVNITARSAKHKTLIEAVEVEHPSGRGDAHLL